MANPITSIKKLLNFEKTWLIKFEKDWLIKVLINLQHLVFT